jgi:hypothetical protein
MTVRKRAAPLSAIAAIALFAVTASAVSFAAPPTVTVSVLATDLSGGTLSYKWKSTDGNIVNVNAASTTWTLPSGLRG